ncbi:hypothetical protein ACI2LF_10330 [Kribbella sp. NPDC020789]
MMRRAHPTTTLVADAAPTEPAPAPAPSLRTEFEFELPRGYLDEDGVLHKSGSMRLATARDELLPLYDARVQENPAFTTVVLLARVITRLGDLPRIDPQLVENMFASDVAFLQDLYRRINSEGHTRAAVTCPSCEQQFAVDIAGGRLGES